MQESLSRRTFMQISGLAAGSLLTMGCNKMNTNEKQIPVGLQLYSVRQQCEKDFAGSIAKVAELGYQGVEFAGFYNNDAQAVRKMLDDNGLQCCGSHLQLAAFQGDDLDSLIEFNKIIGNKNLIIPWLNARDYPTKDDWLKLADQFNSIAAKLEPHGMRVGYHNHTFEFEKIDGEYIWDILIGNTVESVISQLDVGHCFHAGVNPADELKKFPGRAKTVHIKAWSDDNPDALVGEDQVPWPSVIEACRTVAGTEWYIIEEESNPEPPFVAVDTCLKNFRKLLSA